MPQTLRSETGPLRTVILHRPDLELHRITPSNKDELLFDELVWVDRAADEHDAFADTLVGAGAEVLYFEDLLAETMTDDILFEAVLKDHVQPASCGRRLAERTRDYLRELPRRDAVRHLIGGVTLAEAGDTAGLFSALAGPADFSLPPLPNAVFMRDSSVWIGDGVILCPMNRVVRRRETALLEWVYGHHPRFKASTVWFGNEPGEHFPASVEGGDILVVGERAIAIGVTERTTPSGVSALAARLFEQDVIDRVLAVELPKARTTMHLDTVLTMVDPDRIVVYPPLRSISRTLRVTPGPEGSLHVQDGTDLVADMAWAAGVDVMRTIEADLDAFEADREQWNDGFNVFAVGPSDVIAYERNVATNDTLRRAGVNVREIPSYELSRGRGGPRCMTCPVDRAAV
jgi:arginine deiminase